MPNERCWANHLGVWLAEPRWLSEAVQRIRDGTWKPVAQTPGDVMGEEPVRPPFALDDGVAVIDIDGPLMKGRSKFGGTSTRLARRGLRAALEDSRVEGIMLRIDSPGGHVDGTPDLADDVREAARTKPVHAYIEDCGCSAAYWVASQARRVAANRTAEVGSIGVLAVVEDESQRFEEAGIRVHVIATGPCKGAFVPGAPVAAEHIEALRGIVEGLGEEFRRAVVAGRGKRRMPETRLAEVSTGRTWLAPDAQGLGLIDAVEPWKDAMGALRGEARAEAAVARRRRRASALSEILALDLERDS